MKYKRHGDALEAAKHFEEFVLRPEEVHAERSLCNGRDNITGSG